MLYNVEKKEIKKATTCLDCKQYNAVLKKCEGLNKTCFEYDEKTQTIIDGITKMPIKINK